MLRAWSLALRSLSQPSCCQRPALHHAAFSTATALPGPPAAAAATSTGAWSSVDGPDSQPSTSGRGAAGEPKPDLVEKFLGLSNMSRSEAFHATKADFARDFQRHPGDVGSPEVVIAQWTYWIRGRVEHYLALPRHAKAVHTLRHLELVAAKRRRLLAYLRRSSPSGYELCMQRLGLANACGQAHSADRYPVGHAHEDPAGASDAQRRRRFAFHAQYHQKKTHQWKRLLPQLVAEDPALAASSEAQQALKQATAAAVVKKGGRKARKARREQARAAAKAKASA